MEDGNIKYMDMYDYNRANRDQLPYYSVFTLDAKQVAAKYLIESGCHKILDYGCAHGTFGVLGATTTEKLRRAGYGKNKEQPGTINIKPLILDNVPLQIDGYDDCINNKEARYHDRSEVLEHYDAIVASHVIEHMEIHEAEDFIKWTDGKAKHLIITQPLTYNVFSWLHFYTGIDHKRPYDNPDLYYWLDRAGWQITDIVCSDLYYQNMRWYGLLSRMAFAKLTQTSPLNMHTVICKRKT